MTQVLGITWDYIRAKAVKLLGEPVVSALETAFEPFKILVTEGPMGLWEYIKDQFTDLKEMVMDQIQDLMITQVIKAGIKWILGLLNPVGAFVKAAMAIYDIVMFFVDKGSQIMELVNSIIDSVRNIASGAVGGAAQMIENTLGKALPLAIGFLANLLGVGNLAQKVQAIIGKVRKKIDKVVDKFLLKAKKVGQKLLRKLGIGGKDAADQGEAESTSEEKSAGVEAIAKEEQQYVKEGTITHEDAQKTTVGVRQKHPVFKSLTVIDGGNSWDYQYVFRDGGKKVTTSKKAQEDKVNIQLRRPKGFRKSARDALRTMFPNDHKLNVKSKALVKKGLARRHIVPAQEFLDHYSSQLNGLSFKRAVALLESKPDISVATPVINEAIQKAAQKLLANAVNDPDNVWIGDSAENSALQDMYYDPPENWSSQKLEGHYRKIKNKWFLK